MDKAKKKFLIGSFLAIILVFFALNTFISKGSYLYYENRMVEEKLDFTRENIFSGRYFSSLENYLVDSFKGRNTLLSIGTFINLDLIKRPIVNDLYIDEDKLLEVWSRGDEAYPKEEIEEMAKGYGNLTRQIEELGSKFLYVGLPGHGSIFAQDYPKYIYNKGEEWLSIEKDFFEELSRHRVDTIKARDFLSKDPKKFYSKTDHHFSYHGAVELYKNIIDRANKELNLDMSYDDLKLLELGKDSKGSYSRKLFNLDRFSDKTFIYEEDFDYRRRDNGQDVEDKIFHLEQYDEKDFMGYGIYMGGDIGLTEIDTNREDLPNILVYGDSFTNAVETLLLRNSNKLIAVDFRHYEEKTLVGLVEEYRPDLVICIRHNTVYISPEGNGILE